MAELSDEIKEARERKERWEAFERALEDVDETLDKVRKVCVGPDCPTPAANE